MLWVGIGLELAITAHICNVCTQPSSQIVIISPLLLNKNLKLLNIHSLIYFFSNCQSKICYKCDKTNHSDLEKVCFISKSDLFPIIIFTLISASLWKRKGKWKIVQPAKV